MTLPGSGKRDGGHSRGAEARPRRPALAANAMIILIDDCSSAPERFRSQIPRRIWRFTPSTGSLPGESRFRAENKEPER